MSVSVPSPATAAPPGTPTGTAAFLTVRDLTKDFGATRALDHVSIDLRGGVIHALVGENGAGKSTLVKILSGEYGYGEGRILLDERPYRPGSPIEAERRGVVRVPQEPATVAHLSVAENTFLGHLPHRNGFVRWSRVHTEAEALYRGLGIPIDVAARAASLSMAQQQLVAIASALVHEARLLIMDEPTSTITEQETISLFALLRQLRDKGVCILFISHRLHEVFELSEEITVMRDGRVVAERPTGGTNTDELVSLMVGRGLVARERTAAAPSGPPVLELQHLTRRGAFTDISLELRPGEILGLAGLTGSGRSELARAIFGSEPPDAGTIRVDGRAISIRTPRDAIAAGIGYVPEDRKLDGLALDLSSRVNLSVLRLKALSVLGLIRRAQERTLATRLIGQLDVRPSDPELPARSLSGGNQQKIVIGRWLAETLKVLVLDEPTRGVDVGAKAEIHRLMHEMASEGLAILMIASEMDEIMSVSDRIMVMHEGRISGEFNRSEATEEAIVRAASGIVP